MLGKRAFGFFISVALVNYSNFDVQARLELLFLYKYLSLKANE